MTPRKNYTLIFAPEALGHLQAIDRKYYSLIRQNIQEQLSFTPEVMTQNRKRLEQPAPSGATYELRFGPNNRFRVFYEINEKKQRVQVLAIGVKVRNRLMIGGEEYST